MDVEVAAWVDGAPSASTSLVYGPFGFWFYSLDLPVDDPSTPADEGGTDGDSVTFEVGGAAVSASAVFQADTYQRLDLVVPKAADLELLIDDQLDELAAGETATWTLTVTNAGEGQADGIELWVELPAGLGFAGADGGASELDGRVSWPVFDLAEGESAERSVTLEVAATLGANQVSAELVARVVDDGSRGLDPDPADNVARDFDRLVASPDLVVVIDDALESIAPGEMADFTVSVENLGTRDGSRVAVSVALDPAVLFQTADFDGGELQEGVVSWPLLDLAVGESIQRTFRILVPMDLGVGIARLEHRASAQPGNGPDGDADTNTDLDWTDVEQYAGLRPSLLDTASMIQDAQTLEVSGSVLVTIENDGNLDLADAFTVAIFDDADGNGIFDERIDPVLGTSIVTEFLAAGASLLASVDLAGFVSFVDQPLWAMVDSSRVIPELDESDNALSTAADCVAPPPVRQFDPVVEMSWPADDTNLEEPNAKESMSTPIVVQLTDDNGDGRRDELDDPDIVFVAADLVDVLNPRLRLRAIDGATGRSHWAVLPPISDYLTFSLSGLAAGDLDGDGDTEIVVSTPSPPLGALSGHSNHLTAYDHRGRQLWSTRWYQTHPTGSTFTNRDHPTLADLDGNGKSEVIVGGNVFSHSGALKWRGSAGQGYQSARNANRSDSGAISTVVDLDMDGTPEILAGNTAYRSNGTIYWQSPLGDGYTAVGNFDDDDFPEAVVVSRGTVRLHEHDGPLIWGPVDLPGVEPNAGGAPTVADFDGDGEPEIGVAGSDFYTVFEADGGVKWQRAVRDGSSNQTGSTVFDFDADGRSEVVYRDEAYLYIFAGDSGEVLFRDALSSFTANEQPVVVDVDRDGQAEIVVTSDLAINLSGLPRRTTGLRVYGDRNGTWVGARSVWNQHAYSIDNVDDDGGIPRQAAYGWLSHNSFRANVSPVGGPAAAPDLTVSYLRLDRGTLPQATLTVRVGNGGAVRALAGAPVAFYADGSLLGVTSTTAELAPGSYEDVQIQATLPVFGSLELSAVVGDDGSGSAPSLWDCRASNNRHAQTFDFAELGLWTTLNDGRTTVQVGETVTFTLSVGNAGEVTRSGVSVSAYLPQYAFQPSADGGATISSAVSGDEILWPTLDLASGEVQTFTFSYRVDPSLPLDVTQLSTRAWVRDDGTVPDPTPWDRSVVDVNRVSSVRADAGGPYSGLEGVPVTFDGSASTDRNGTVVAWAWDFDGDGSFDDGSGPVATHTFLDDGEFTVWLRVTDNSGESATTAVQVELSNQDPIADAGAPLSATEGGGVTLSAASFTDPGSLDTHTVEVDWGDGQVSDGVVESGGELRAGHFYVDDGVYTVQVCVRDDDGGSGCDTTSVTVSNVAPEVLDDGAVDLATWLPQHLSTDPSDQGSWEVSEDGTSVLQTQNVGPTVLLSPFAASGVTLEGEVRPGDSSDDDFFGFVIGFEPDDFNNPEADYLVFDWKKGVQYSESIGLARVGTAMSRVHGIPRVSELWSHEARPTQPSDAFDELAKGLEKGSQGWSYGTTYRFRIQVESMRLRLWIDDQLELDLSGDFDFGDGRFGFYNFSQEDVRYRAFTAIGEGIVEGDEVALSLKFVDPGSDDVHTADVDWADGSVTELDVEPTSYGGIVSGTHVYPDDGIFEAEACVDDGTDRGCGTVPFTVLNLAPSFEAGPHRAANSASPVVLDIPFTDPGVLDSHEAEIEWGDGTFESLSYPAGGGRIQGTKSYESDGIYPVEICLTDNGGARRCDGFEVLWGDPFVDLAARVWSVEPAVRQGGMATVVVEAENLGSATVTGMELVYELPTELTTEMTFVEAFDGGVYDPPTQRVVWTAPSLGFREKATFTVKVQAPDSSPPSGSVELVGRATASHDSSAGIDVDVSNDSAEHTILWLDEQTPYPVIEGVDGGLEADEGHTLRLTATIDDPDHDPDPDSGSGEHTVTADWGDGTTGTLVPVTVQGVEQITATHRYLDDGIYTLRLCVSDGTHEGCQSLPVRVRNLAPDLIEADENVDLRLWQTQDLEIGSQNPANWIPTDDGSHVYQTVNARASVYTSDFPAFGTRLATQMWVGPKPEFDSQTDDDYLGLVLGWSPGDAFEADGDFLLISWKQKNDEGAKKGLWVSRITGRPSNLWRLDEASSGVEVLAKARTLDEEGWEWWRLYDWEVQYDAHQLKVWVDGSLEFDLYNPEGDFPAGSFGFYNYSQDRVMYRGVGRTGFGGVEGSPTAVHPLFVDGGELDTHWASVRWGDGEGPDAVPVSKTGTVSTVLGEHVYAEDGSYISRVCAVDDDGGRGCGLVEVEIRNAPPVIDPGPPADVPFGMEFSLTDVVLTDPGILDTHQVSIDWGDGSSGPALVIATEEPGTFTVQAVHTYASDLGDYAVTICAIDDEGAEGCGIKTLTVVGSTEPQELSGQIGPGEEGGLVQLTGTFLDPDAGDTHTSTIDWGDGSPVETLAVSGTVGGGAVVGEHTYIDDGVYTARWCVFDSASQSSCLDVPALIENLSPIRGQEGGEAGSSDGFHRWQREDLNDAGDWLISDEGRRVRQRSNADGTFFYGHSPVLGARSHVTARMWEDDDDYIGLALGFEPGDLTNPDADYLMVLWKKTAQSGAPAGLKIARIRGTQRNFWGQGGVDFELLGQGAIHGERGWRLNADYRFSFELTTERLRLWVNDRLEADLEAPADDPFSDGRFALFTYAQQYVVYRDFEQQALPGNGGPEDGRATHFWAGADLSQWQAEGFLNGDTPAGWTLVNDAEFVRVTTNSRPSALLSPEDHLWRRLRFVARPFEDNDYFGLVIGYRPGDAFNPEADYLLMVWKRASEDGSLKGLKLYRISGRPASFWDLTGTAGVSLVASAETLGDTGWDFGADDYYEFEVDPKPDQLRIWVNGRLQFDVATPVPAGRYGLYVYRQDAMRFIGTRLESAGVFYEGDTSIPLGAGFTDRGRLDTHVGSVVWNDGSDPMTAEVAQLRGLGSVLLPEHVLLDDLGSAGPTVCATDDDGGEGCRELPLRVLNVAPTVDAGAPLEGVVGLTVTLQGSYSDPGVLDTHTYTVDWGDGSEPSTGTAGGGAVATTHVYAAEGVYTVELCLTDDDGGQGCDTTTVDIGDAVPGQTIFCEDESFDQPAETWQSAEIGDGVGSVSMVDGRLRVSGTGSELYHGDDHGVFAYRELEGDFRVELSLAELTVDAGGDYRKACLMVRSSSAPDAARAMVCYVPDFPDGPAWQFDARSVDGGPAQELASNRLGALLPNRLAFVRRGDELRVSLSEDGGLTWTEPAGGLGGAVTLEGAPAVLQVGAMVASYDPATAITADFDDFRVCHKATAEIPPIEPTVCDASKPLDVIYLLDMSESMTADYPGAEPGAAGSKLSAATLGLSRLHDRLALRSDGGRTALLTYHGFNDVQSNLDGAVDVRAPLSGDPTAVSAVLSSLTDADVAPLATTPTGPALEEAVEMLTAEGNPEHRTAVILVTDGVPNIDREGRGPVDYRLPEIQAISLTDGQGEFRPWPEVAWLGGFNGAYGTFDGEPLANAVYALDRLVAEQPGLKVYGVGIRGDGVELGTYNLDLVDYAAWVSGGLSFAPTSHDEMEQSIDELLRDLECDAPATGAITGRLWNDLDGDGVQDAFEPGLPSVEVELLDDQGTVSERVTTDEHGSYLLVDVAPGPAWVRVRTQSLPAGLEEATYDLDGGVLGQATPVVSAYEIYDGVDFGYRASVVSPPEAVAHTVCEVETFDGPSLDAAWTLRAVGNAAVGDAEIVSGRLEVSSDGSGLWSWDHFHFVFRPAPEGDFRVEVEIADVPVDPGGDPFRKGGLHLRSGLDSRSARLMVNYLPYLADVDGPALQFGYRAEDGGPSESLSQVVGEITLPIQLAIERRGTTHTVWYSTDDGTTWQQEIRAFANGVVDLDLGSSPQIGVGLASYQPSAPMTFAFDDWAECRADETPLPTPPVSACDPTRALDMVAVLDLSGSMKSSFDGVPARWEAAKAVVDRWAELLASRGDGSRLGVVVYDGTDDPALNLERGARVWAGLSDPLVSASTLAGLTSDAISVDAGSAGASALSRAGQLLMAGDSEHRPVLLWISDEPPTVDVLGRGPYGEEGAPLSFDLRDGEGDFLPPGRVAWMGPFQGDWGTFAGEPLADAMDQIALWKTLLPSLSVVGVGLDGDAVESPIVDHDLLEFATSYASGAFYEGADVMGLLSATDQAYLALVCE